MRLGRREWIHTFLHDSIVIVDKFTISRTWRLNWLPHCVFELFKLPQCVFLCVDNARYIVTDVHFVDLNLSCRSLMEVKAPLSPVCKTTAIGWLTANAKKRFTRSWLGLQRTSDSIRCFQKLV